VIASVFAPRDYQEIKDRHLLVPDQSGDGAVADHGVDPENERQGQAFNA
jgi:hypothetical protein